VNTALFILAAGSSKRFGHEDKLMADLSGKPVLQHVIEAASVLPFKSRYGIVPENSVHRRALFESFNCSVIDNIKASLGQGSSLSLAAKTAISGSYDSLIVLLGDMPFITGEHLEKILISGTNKTISQLGDNLMPPIAIKRSMFSEMAAIDPKIGAKAMFKMDNVEKISFSSCQAQDIDTQESLAKWADYAK